MQTKEERRGELKRLAATPNGIDKLYAILTRNFIPFLPEAPDWDTDDRGHP
jgi:hypothetical protein